MRGVGKSGSVQSSVPCILLIGRRLRVASVFCKQAKMGVGSAQKAIDDPADQKDFARFPRSGCLQLQ